MQQMIVYVVYAHKSDRNVDEIGLIFQSDVEIHKDTA